MLRVGKWPISDRFDPIADPNHGVFNPHIPVHVAFHYQGARDVFMYHSVITIRTSPLNMRFECDSLLSPCSYVGHETT